MKSVVFALSCLALGFTVAAEELKKTEGRATLKTRITVSPTYPPAALSAHREGSVIVCFYVDEEGKVVDAMVLSSTHPDFESAALDAAKRTLYEVPEKLDGESNYTCLRYRFRL